jgi:hypothetical protein
MRVIVSAGGTGGHIYPAISIIKKIKEIDKDSEILYIGTTNRMEATIVPKEGIPYFGVRMIGLKKDLSIFKAGYLFLKAIRTCKKKIKEFKPDIVIGVGGYITTPVIYASSKLHIPTAIHEQNSIPGKSNKFLTKKVDKIFVSLGNTFSTVMSNFILKMDELVKTLINSNKSNDITNSIGNFFKNLKTTAKTAIGIETPKTETNARAEEPSNPFTTLIAGFENMHKETLNMLSIISTSLLNIEKSKIKIDDTTGVNRGVATDGNRPNTLQNINVSNNFDMSGVIDELAKTNKYLDGILVNTSLDVNGNQQPNAVWSI